MIGRSPSQENGFFAYLCALALGAAARRQASRIEHYCMGINRPRDKSEVSCSFFVTARVLDPTGRASAEPQTRSVFIHRLPQMTTD